MNMKITIAEPKQLNNNVLYEESAFLSFEYNNDIINYIKSLPIRAYDPYSKQWEIPTNYISQIEKKFPKMNIEIIGNINKTTYIDEIPKDYKFKTKPFKHQIEAINFGLEHEKFLLGDEQGAGKTKTIIDWCCCNPNTTKVLIICGVNSLKYNWLEEIEKHSNEKGFVLGTRTRKNGKIYEGTKQDKLDDLDNLPEDCKFIITNIETLRLGAEKISKTKYDFPFANKIRELCNNGIINTVAVDEVHKIKNPNSMQGKALSIIQAKYQVAMSGTPLMNNPIDLYFSLNWLGYEDKSYWQFRNKYCLFGGWNDKEIIGYKNLDTLKARLQSIMIRRLKTEIFDLPEKLRTNIYLDMPKKQQKFYRDYENNLIKGVKRAEFVENPLALLIKLRQITAYPPILDKSVIDSAKMDKLVEMVEDITNNGDKVVIFSNWTSVTKVCKDKLRKYMPAYITGDVEIPERQEQVRKFQNNDKCKVIIGTTGAMGTGFTLTAAQNVIFMDSPWNRALKDQAEDRVHRIGTTGTVNIYTLVCKDTIDERIETLVYKKGVISDGIVDNKVTIDDIYFMLGI